MPYNPFFPETDNVVEHGIEQVIILAATSRLFSLCFRHYSNALLFGNSKVLDE